MNMAVRLHANQAVVVVTVHCGDSGVPQIRW